jgi:hypothetical protein
MSSMTAVIVRLRAIITRRGWRRLSSHLIGNSALAAFVALSVVGSAQADDGSQSASPDNKSNWLCRGLPFQSSGGTFAGQKIANVDEKMCAASIYLGIEQETGQEHMFGIKGFVPPYEYKFGSSGFIGGSLSRVVGEIGKYAAIETEVGAGQRFGSLHEEEVWGAVYFRWKYFPWNDYLRTTVAASTGLSYASAVPEIETTRTTPGSRLLHYLSPEITFSLPSNPDTELVIRSQHRSGGGTLWGTNVPVYGSLFHGAGGGVQYLVLGFRQHF